MYLPSYTYMLAADRQQSVGWRMLTSACLYQTIGIGIEAHLELRFGQNLWSFSCPNRYLYELTMLQGYWQHQMYETAVFEFFVRSLPTHRNFLIAAGLEQAIGYLEGLAFSPAEIEWLEQTRPFPAGIHKVVEKLALYRRCECNAGGNSVFHQRTNLAGDCTATRSAICRDTPDQPA